MKKAEMIREYLGDQYQPSDEELIKELKKQHITEITQDYLDKMKLLGLQLEDIKSYITIVSEKSKK